MIDSGRIAEHFRSFGPVITMYRLQLTSVVSSGGNFHSPYAERGQCVHVHEAAGGYPQGRQCYQVADQGPVHTISPFQGYNRINKDILSLVQ